MQERLFHIEDETDNHLEVWSTREIVYAIQDKIPGQYFKQARIALHEEDTSLILSLEDTDEPTSDVRGQLIGELTFERVDVYASDESGKRRVRRKQYCEDRLFTLSLEASVNMPCTVQLGNNIVSLLWQEHNGTTVMGSLSRNGTFVPGPLVFGLDLLGANGIIFISNQPTNLTTIPNEE